MLELLLAAVAFVGSHFVLSHGLRARLVDRLGEKGFRGLYSVVALGTLVWMVQAYRRAPDEVLWTAPVGLQHSALLLMLLAAILFVGAFNRRNAALAGAPLATRPTGALRITRHPMNWAFAIWAVVHGALAGRTATLVLTGAIFTLAIVGSALQEVKKRRADPGWANYARQTSFFPFAKGRFWPGAVPVVGGILIIILASWLHPQLGAPAIPPLVWFT